MGKDKTGRIFRLVAATVMALAFSFLCGPRRKEIPQAPELTGSMSVSLSTGQAAGALTDDNVSTYKPAR